MVPAASAGANQPEDDISENLLPLSLFFALVCMIESAPMLLLKAYMLGDFMEPSVDRYLAEDALNWSTNLQAASGMLLFGSVCLSLTFQALVPILLEKVGSDFRGIFVMQGNRVTRHGGRQFNVVRCACLFGLRFFEGLSWLLTLAGVAHAASAWFFFLLLAIDFSVSCVLSCALADPNEDDWEIRSGPSFCPFSSVPQHPKCTDREPEVNRGLCVSRSIDIIRCSATFRVFFSLFFTNPAHDGDAVMVFRARAPSNIRPRPTKMPLLLHYGARLLQQTVAVLLMLVAGSDGVERLGIHDGVVVLCVAIAVCTAVTWATLALAVRIMPGPEAIIRCGRLHTLSLAVLCGLGRCLYIAV